MLTLLLSVAFAQPAPASGEIIDRVVAIVNGRALTQSQLELEARVALIQRGGLWATTVALSDSDLRAALDLAIAHRLANEEAERLQVFAVEQAEVDSALQAFRSRFPSERAFRAFLARQEVDEKDVEAILGRALRAERFLDSKVRLRSQVSEQDVRQYYGVHAAQLGKPFEAVRASIREKLDRERYAQLIQLEAAQARRAADVRLVAPFVRQEGSDSR